jgi:hypothetical protein
MTQFILALGAVIICLFIQAIDDFLSHFGVVSALHGGLLGYGQIYVARDLLEWGGGSLEWLVVILITAGVIAVAIYKSRYTWTTWISAFNFGIFAGIMYGGFSLI